MSTSSIPPIPSNYGIGRLNPNNQRRRQGKPFEEALEREASAEAEDSAAHETAADTRPLQPEAPRIRRESQDGRHHIDVIA